MEERTDDGQLELLAKIHNQLVDLKQIILEIELSRPGTSHTLQIRLRQVMGSVDHVNIAGHADMPTSRQQKVIAPTDTTIEPGQGS
jgi:hypothetical protein